MQLREKQKVKRIYGAARAAVPRLLLQGRRARRASPARTLLQLLERRLDNVVYRMGFAGTHAEARQLVRHGHFTVNGKRVNIPSYLVQPGRRSSRCARRAAEDRAASTRRSQTVDRRGVPQWLELDKKNFTGTVKAVADPRGPDACRSTSS